MSSLDVRLVRGPIVPQREVVRPLADDGAGGECLFIGRTRPETSADFGPLRALEYEAHESMALRVIESIAHQECLNHGCAAAQVLHAVGRIEVGEVSVMVRVAARGRDEAFAACRAIIDRLKAEAPIWKRELWARGSTWQTGVPASVPSAPERGR